MLDRHEGPDGAVQVPHKWPLYILENDEGALVVGADEHGAGGLAGHADHVGGRDQARSRTRWYAFRITDNELVLPSKIG